MASPLKLEIVTPEGVVYSDPAVHLVTLPAADGQIGIYAQHTPLLTRLVPGEIIVERNGGHEFLAVGGGLVEVTADSISIVTDSALRVEEIDEARAEDARQRALARLRDKIDDEEVATVNAALARTLAQLSVKRRHKGRTT